MAIDAVRHTRIVIQAFDLDIFIADRAITEIAGLNAIQCGIDATEQALPAIYKALGDERQTTAAKK